MVPIGAQRHGRECHTSSLLPTGTGVGPLFRYIRGHLLLCTSSFRRQHFGCIVVAYQSDVWSSSETGQAATRVCNSYPIAGGSTRSPITSEIADDPLRMAGHFTGLGVIRQLDAKGDDILGLIAWGKYPLVWFCWRSLLTCRVTVFLSREESSYRSSQDYDFPTRP